MRLDFNLIESWVKPNSRILDLGCGTGLLLKQLKERKQIQGYGLEINLKNVHAAVKNGINVIEQDIDQGLNNFEDDSFDIVIMTQTLQTVKNPSLILDEMVRVGKSCIIGFPNFGHWRCRSYLLGQGKMPVSNFMPHTWYNTPNIHFCTINDFNDLLATKNINILNTSIVDQHNKVSFLTQRRPNLFGVMAIYHMARADT